MKKIFFTPLLLLVSLLFFDSVALANSNLSTEELNRLYNLGFDDRDIQQMNDEELEYNLQFDGELVAKEIKYLKVVEDNSSNSNTLSSLYSRTLPLDENNETTIELTKEQFEKEVANEKAKRELESLKDFNRVNILSNPDTHPATSYKIFQTSITRYSNSRFRVMSKVSWHVPPTNRKIDVIATTVNSAEWTIDAGTQYGKQWWYSTHKCGRTSSTGEAIYNNTSAKWFKGFPGVYPLSINLPNSNWDIDPLHVVDRCYKEVVQSIDAYAYYEVIRVNTTPVNIIDAYGYYGHQETTYQITPSFGIGYGGPTVGFSISKHSSFTHSNTHAQVKW